MRAFVGWSYNFIVEYRAAILRTTDPPTPISVSAPLWCPPAEGSSAVCACFSPQIAEATAILRGIRFAVDSGFLPAVVESDVKSVVDIINSGMAPLADIGLVIQDILLLLSCFLFLFLLLLGV
ncbi:hypothetical protein LWI28_006320 [Acer negundo]|uniref:RNase H type-1 domain-containing protein n=1 Tax=Acer negundo TaxID=4023 RepID=A0AAD5J325_ACENE|nr:hypothetical protein LWI28_006320 [Acer negundo]